MAKAKAKEPEFEFENLNAECGSFSIHGERCRLRITLQRQDVALGKADRALVQGQLRLRLEHNPAKHGDVSGQGTLVDTKPHQFEGICEVGTISVNKDSLSFSIGLPRDHQAELNWFSSKRVQVSFVRMGDAVKAKATVDADADGDEDAEDGADA